MNKVGFLDAASLSAMSITVEDANSFLAAVMIIFQTWFMIMLYCSILLVHLSYYIIAHYIQLLRTTISLKHPMERYFFQSILLFMYGKIELLFKQ